MRVLTTKMSSWYGGISTDARTAACGSDRRSGRCEKRVRRGGEATRTRLNTRHVGAWVPRDAAASFGETSDCAWRGRRGAGARARRRDATSWRRAWPTSLVLLSLGLNEVYSKILNKSAQSFEYESCRSYYSLQHS
jgi:hypothetical protein